jgi:hypothetical protein
VVRTLQSANKEVKGNTKGHTHGNRRTTEILLDLLQEGDATGARVKRSGEQRGSRAPSKVTFTAGQRCEIFEQGPLPVPVPVSAGKSSVLRQTLRRRTSG